MSQRRAAPPVLIALALSVHTIVTAAAPAALRDSDQGSKNTDRGDKPFWAGSTLAWTQSASGATLGIGQNYQSKNPTYDWAFSLVPVFTLYDEKPLSLRLTGDASVYREFTNSDGTIRNREFTPDGTTTRRGEWEWGNLQAGAVLGLLAYESGLYRTSFDLRAPSVTFPTSKMSANSGRILRLGSSLGVSQAFPLRGEGADSFRSFSVSASAGYLHTFTEAVVPTNSDMQRIRLTPDGQALRSDQLREVAFAKHRASFTLALGTPVTDRISLDTGFTWSPVWKYKFAKEVNVCNLATGCVIPDRVSDPPSSHLITGFTVGVGVQVFDAMNLSASYANVTLQLGPDGKRRQPFYSPDASVSLSVLTSLDELYKLARGESQSGSSRAQKSASR